MTRTNVLTTAKRIRRHLRTGYRNEQTVLTADIDATATGLVVSPWFPSIQPGTTLGIDTELVRVLSANSGAGVVTVLRGYLDSEPATHTTGSLVDIAPRFSLLDVVDAMQSEVSGWGQQLYWPLDMSIVVATSANTLELPVSLTEMLGIVAVHQSESALNTVWPTINAKLIRGTPTGFNGASTSGALLRFTEPVRTGKVFLVAAMAFDPLVLADLTKDLLTDAHMSPGIVDVLELGTQRRLVTQDTDSRGARAAQDEPRRSEETPVGASNPVNQFQFGIYTKRKSEEVARLRRRFPIRKM